MDNSVLLSCQAFEVEDRIRVEAVRSSEFWLTAPPEGGGIRLLTGTVSSSVWTACEFVAADVYHECHDVLVLLFGFGDQEGRSITYHVGILPKVLTTVCLPLKHLDGEKLFLPLSRYAADGASRRCACRS